MDFSKTIKRLNKRGIIAFEVDGVLARLTKAQSQGSRLQFHEGLAHAAAELAAQIRARVQGKGDLAGQAPSKRAKRKIILSADYARAAGLPVKSDRFGTTITGGIADLYAKTGRPLGSATVTGGMWAGLQARASGADSAIIDFAGSSEGRGKPVFGKVAAVNLNRSAGSSRHNTQRRTLVSTHSERVRNQWKGGAIYSTTGVNVLLPEQAEVDRIAGGIAVRLQAHALQALQG